MSFPWVTFLWEMGEDLTYLAKVPFSNDGLGELFLKLKDPPIIKSFAFNLSGAVGATVTRTIEWSNTFTGESVADIKAGASNKLLVVIKAKNGSSSFPATLSDLYASNTADTADGTKIIDTTWGIGLTFGNPPIPIILDVNQFLTVVINIHASFADTINFVGFTVELPSNFTLS